MPRRVMGTRAVFPIVPQLKIKGNGYASGGYNRVSVAYLMQNCTAYHMRCLLELG